MQLSTPTRDPGGSRSLRRIQPELLDHLPATDPRALSARCELRRVNAWMGNARILARALQMACPLQPARSIAEIGAGDGSLMLAVARRLSPRWREVKLTLIDRQDLLAPATARQFEQLGWKVAARPHDVFEWISTTEPYDILVANLFLHHFDDAGLARLLAQAAAKSNLLVACEPRRFAHPRLASQLLRLIGCGALTRHDAAVSIQAGFTGQEISRLWPSAGGWLLQEREAGLFSHLFWARRTS